MSESTKPTFQATLGNSQSHSGTGTKSRPPPPIEEREYYEPPLEFGEVEDFRYYNRGGFHPVDIGDILNSRFEVIHKLGCGGFGIVWLCHDRDFNKWRAVKILTADLSAESSNQEVKTLAYLRDQASGEKLERNHIGVALEHFYIEGPNGRHLCFVMPVFGCSVSRWRSMLNCEEESTVVASRNICRQVAKGLRFLHSKGIAHGDLKPGNILMRVDGIDDLDRSELGELLGEPDLEPMETTSGDDPRPWAPQYCVKPVSQTWCKRFLIEEVTIIDFGESFHVDSPKNSLGIPPAYAAPELIFPKTRALGFSSDVWALACVMFEIKTGDILFENASRHDLDATVREFELFLGPLPDPYRTAWKGQEHVLQAHESASETGMLGGSGEPSSEANAYASEDATALLEETAEILAGAECSHVLEGTLVKERTVYRPLHPGDARSEPLHFRFPRNDALMLADLLCAMLKYEPNDRMTSEEVCRHPWLGGKSRLQGISDRLGASRVGDLLKGLIFVLVLSLSAIVLHAYATSPKDLRPHSSGILQGLCLPETALMERLGKEEGRGTRLD
ncbi:hypothetical protein DL765_011148 [Monosporascus sp. GIB2]|nr:hypothetical protein DL765_011148 [Monosporascus sp. GIB2]